MWGAGEGQQGKFILHMWAGLGSSPICKSYHLNLGFGYRYVRRDILLQLYSVDQGCQIHFGSWPHTT